MSDETLDFIASTIVATFAGLIGGLGGALLSPESAPALAVLSFALTLTLCY